MLRTFFRKFRIVRRAHFLIRFIIRNKYVPNFRNPKTYNEKVNYRKNQPMHELFSVCADKVAAKDYVANIVGEEVIIKNLYVGKDIEVRQLREILNTHGDVMIKANHNSGPVHAVSPTADDIQLAGIIEDIRDQLKIDFGLMQNEPWYSEIERKILVEEKLDPEPGETDIRDYRFHVFNHADGGSDVVIEVEFNTNTNHTRSFFDEALNYLPFSLELPSIITKITTPQNFDQMLIIAREVAKPFSHARVDLYNVHGKIYFAEITFAHASGGQVFSFKAYDNWMGTLWTMDPRR